MDEISSATNARRHFTMRSIASRTEGVLIVPQGTLSSKKDSCLLDNSEVSANADVKLCLMA